MSDKYGSLNDSCLCGVCLGFWHLSEWVWMTCEQTRHRKLHLVQKGTHLIPDKGLLHLKYLGPLGMSGPDFPDVRQIADAPSPSSLLDETGAGMIIHHWMRLGLRWSLSSTTMLGKAGTVALFMLGLVEEAGDPPHHNAWGSWTQTIWAKVHWMRWMDGGHWQVKSQCVDCCSTMSVSVHSHGQTPRAQQNGTAKEQPRHLQHPITFVNDLGWQAWHWTWISPWLLDWPFMSIDMGRIIMQMPTFCGGSRGRWMGVGRTTGGLRLPVGPYVRCRWMRRMRQCPHWTLGMVGAWWTARTVWSCELHLGKSTGKPVGLKCATHTHTHGIPLTRSAKAGYNVGMGLRVWVAMQESTKITHGYTWYWWSVGTWQVNWRQYSPNHPLIQPPHCLRHLAARSPSSCCCPWQDCTCSTFRDRGWHG